MKNLLYLIVNFAFVTPYTLIFRGWALSKLYAWFVAATFEVAQLTIPQCIGITLVSLLLTNHNKIDLDKKRENSIKKTFQSVFATAGVCLMLVGAGYIVKFWI